METLNPHAPNVHPVKPHRSTHHIGGSAVEDRLYQIAALTAGFFLLATLL